MAVLAAKMGAVKTHMLRTLTEKLRALKSQCMAAAVAMRPG